jgi:DNA-binding transcriptional MerR regulator
MVEVTVKPSGRFFTVGRAAEELGVTPTTLRNWDKAGKLSARRHPINKYRLFAEADIEALKNVISGEKK